MFSYECWGFYENVLFLAVDINNLDISEYVFVSKNK